MPIDAVNNTTNPTQALGMQDLLRVLLTQLTSQDPLKPMDNQEFMGQMAQFSSLEQTRLLTDRIDSLLGIQAVTESVGLLGRTVEVTTADGPVAGQVTTLTLANGKPELTLKLASGQILTGIGLDRVTTVR